MTKSNRPSGGQRLRTTAIAGLLAGACGMAPAAADGDGIKDSAKKTERGFGELLKGIGQEVKKAGDAVTTGTKDKKRDEKQTDKGKEDRK